MVECVSSLREMLIFSTLDMTIGYGQVETNGRDPKKTAFASHHYLYQFVRTRSGTKHEPATFQRAMSFVLSFVK